MYVQKSLMDGPLGWCPRAFLGRWDTLIIEGDTRDSESAVQEYFRTQR
jgi:hypothetical protein